MNYQKTYDTLVNKRLQTPATGYTEKHHILPKSMGGSDEPSNLVVLTAREHWIAHLLLYKIHGNDKMLFACHMMAMGTDRPDRIKTSRIYQKIREAHSKNIGKYTSKPGKTNSQYGSMWVSNIDLRENKKIPKDSVIPEGFVKGRNKWSLGPEKKCVTCGSNFQTKTKHRTCSEECLIILSGRSPKADRKILAEKLFNEWKASGLNSLNSFYKISNYDHSQVSLRHLFIQYIEEYKPIHGRPFFS